jgi:hypothetical protein
MSETGVGEVESQPMCAEHPVQAAVRTCARCGRYVCAGCERAEGLCRECGVLAVPDSRARARWTVRCFQFSAVLDLLAFVGFGVLLAGAGDDTVLWMDVTNLTVFAGTLGGMVAQIALLMWFHRLVRQLIAQGMGIGVTPAMGVWWWIIPLANWVKPYQLMRDAAEKLGGTHFAASLPLPFWWGAYILSRILSRFDGQTVRGRGAAEAVVSSAGNLAGCLGALTSLISALLCVQILRALQSRMDRRRQGDETLEQLPAPESDVAEAA